MKKQIAQQLVYLICEHAHIQEPEEQFPHHCIGVNCRDAYKILDGLVKLGMIPPTIEVGDSGFIKTTELLDYTELDYEIKWEEK